MVVFMSDSVLGSAAGGRIELVTRQSHGKSPDQAALCVAQKGRATLVNVHITGNAFLGPGPAPYGSSGREGARVFLAFGSWLSFVS